MLSRIALTRRRLRLSPMGIHPAVMAVTALAALAGSAMFPVSALAVCDDFETGYSLGDELRDHPDWFYEGSHSGPRPQAGIGVAGSVGLTNGNTAFTWVAHGFTYSDSSFGSCEVSLDFETDNNGELNDDRIGWSISDTDDSSNWQFCVQVDPNSGGPGGAIECYWDGNSFGDNGCRYDIVDLPSLTPLAWYRMRAVFTKLTATSCRIDVSLSSLDGAGNETALVASGTLPDTDGLSGGSGEEKPNPAYFTSPMMWPTFKNYFVKDGAADNPCFVLNGGGGINTPPDPPTLVAPQDLEGNLGLYPALRVDVTDPEDDPVDVTFYGRPVPDNPPPPTDFTLVVMPDTQNYADSHPEIFDAQVEWVIASRESLNTVFMAHEGDIVDDFGQASEWLVADAALGLLEDPVETGLPEGIPYSVLPGNHDQPTILFNQYFGISRFSGRSYWGGHHGSDNDNNVSFFSGGGMDFVLVSLEMDPSGGAIAWADSVLGAHASRRGILVCHNLIDVDGDWDGEGDVIYDAVKDNANLFLMLCAHRSGEAMRTDTFNGNTIHTVLSCYQSLPQGGNGWLRTMEFQPALDRIRVTTYSPTLDAFGTDSVMGSNTVSEEFFLPYDMATPPVPEGEPWVAIGTVTGVPSGAQAALTWPALDPETDYEWYAEVTDGAFTNTNGTWQFSTGTATAVAEAGPVPGVRLLGNYPNPGRPGTRIRFELPGRRDVAVRVYDVSGRAVATLAEGPREAGLQEITWDGRDRSGRPLPSGIYFYRVTGYGEPRTGKMTILR